ncbi:MAG: hypothetical protein MUF50_04175 [Planctomycetes bacterium]|nr:hypothetical protein [Planctomycetota bacterium]
MKKLIILVMFVSSLTTQGQEIYTLINKDKIQVIAFNANLMTKLNDRWGILFFVLVTDKWGNSSIGPTYSIPSIYATAFMGIGVENNPNVYRFSQRFIVDGPKYFWTLNFEEGGGKDNWWYNTILKYKYSDKFKFGAFSRRYHGTGPIIESTGLSSGVTFMGGPLYDLEDKKIKFILSLSKKF